MSSLATGRIPRLIECFGMEVSGGIEATFVVNVVVVFERGAVVGDPVEQLANITDIIRPAVVSLIIPRKRTLPK